MILRKSSFRILLWPEASIQYYNYPSWNQHYDKFLQQTLIIEFYNPLNPLHDAHCHKLKVLSDPCHDLKFIETIESLQLANPVVILSEKPFILQNLHYLKLDNKNFSE